MRTISPGGPSRLVLVAGLVTVLAIAPSRAARAGCVGDCDRGGTVTIGELIVGVNIALGYADVTACPSFDVNGDHQVTISELITAVNNALSGCPAVPSLTPTPTPIGPTSTATPSTLTLAPVGDRTVGLGSTLSLHLSAFDPQGRPLLFSAAPIPLPANASLDGASGLFTFRPAAEEVGALKITFSVSAGEASVSETITITVTGAPPDGVTALTGRVLDTTDAARGIETAVVGATVSIKGTNASSRTGADGRFTLSDLPPGGQVFDIDPTTANPAPDGSPYAGFHQGIDLAAGVTTVVDRPFYLPRLAVASLTTVDPNSTTMVTNQALGVTLEIPAHTARADDGLPFDGQVSISEVPGALAPEALPPGVQPGMLITIQPLGVTFDTPLKLTMPNVDHLPPGTQTDLWSLNPETGQFAIVGRGQVSGDGTVIETISGGVRAADWHFFLPPSFQPLANFINNVLGAKGSKGLSCKCGSDTSVSSGELREEHVLASYRSFSTARSLRFVYGSERAGPHPILSAALRPASAPRISTQLSVGGVEQGPPLFTDTTNLGPNDIIRSSVQFDATQLPTARYPYTITVSSHYAMSVSPSTVDGEVIVDNESGSPFGAGWTLAGLERLSPQSNSDLLLVDGDGTTTVFENPLDKWRTGPAMPIKRGFLTAITLPDGIHLIGGNSQYSGFGNASYTAHEVFNPKTGSFTDRAPMPDFFTQSQVAVELDGKIYLVGALLRVYDPTTDTWESRARPPGDGFRNGFVAGVVGGKIYVIGGADADFYSGYPDRSYDPASDTWSDPLGSIPIGHFSQAGAVIGDEIYVVGTGGPELQIYTPATNTWRRGADLPIATSAPSATVVDGKLYVLGGSPVGSDPAAPVWNSVQIYDPTTDTWSMGPTMPTKAQWSAAAFSTGKLCVFGGFDEHFQTLDTTQELTLVADDPPVWPGPPGDFTRMVLNADGTFTRQLPDGTRVEFDANGSETAVVERTGKTTHYEYDSDRLTRIVDPAGLATTFTYTGGLLDEVVDPAGRHTAFEHDGSGNLTSITDPDGSNRQFAYDTRHHLVSQTSKRGFVTTYLYDFAGRNVVSERPDGSSRQVDAAETVGLADPRSCLGTEAHPLAVVRDAQIESAFTDGNGNVTHFTTDDAGSGTLTVDALGQTTTTIRNPDGLAVDVSRVDGVHTTSRFDGLGNPVSVTEAVGFLEQRVASITYDDFSQPTSHTDPDGNRTTVAYTGPNPTQVVDAEGTQTALHYDDPHCPGLVTMSTTAPGLPEQNTSAFAYDPATCNLVRLTDALGSSTTFTYDAAGNVIAMVDGASRTTRFSYDALNRVTRTIDATNADPDPPCGVPGVRCEAYDAQGNLASVTDGRGSVTSFAYDSLDRLVGRTDPLGRVEVIAYDANGNPISTTDREGQVTQFALDALNRRVSETVPPGPGVGLTALGYDRVGNLTAVNDPSAALTSAYDHLDEPTSATLGPSVGSPQTHNDYTWTKSGLRSTLAVTTANNPTQSVTYHYDAGNRLAALAAQGPAAFAYEYHYDAAGRPTTRGPTAGGAGVATHFDLDASTRITRMTQTSPDGAATFADLSYTYDAVGDALSAQDDAGTTNYTYDGLYRLTDATGPGIDEAYTYDPAGNRLSKNGVTYQYDAAGRLVSSSDGTTYTYDANGNLRTKTVGSATTNYTWNAQEHLSRIDFPDGTFAAYAYDAFGRRLSKTDRTGAVRYYAYDGADLVEELDASGAVLASYVYESLDQPLSMTRGGVTYYYMYDRLGSVVGLSDGAGTLVARYRYDPWGNLLAAEGTNPTIENPFRFTGREWDAESGLYYYRMRYYDPAVGRFLSEDHLGRGSTAPSGYVYASDNPVNAVDPTGFIELSLRRGLQVLGGVALGAGAGFVVVVSAPAWGLGTIATIGVAALAGGGTGAAFGGAVELAGSETDCNGHSDRDLLAGIAAGFKGGFFGGATTGVVLAGNPAFVNAFEGTSVGEAAQAIGNFGRALLDPRSVIAVLKTATPAQQLAIAAGYSVALATPAAFATYWVVNKTSDLVFGRGDHH